MGRWFGYREGYADLPRIWMTKELRGWFRHIAGGRGRDPTGHRPVHAGRRDAGDVRGADPGASDARDHGGGEDGGRRPGECRLRRDADPDSLLPRRRQQLARGERGCRTSTDRRIGGLDSATASSGFVGHLWLDVPTDEVTHVSRSVPGPREGTEQQERSDRRLRAQEKRSRSPTQLERSGDRFINGEPRRLRLRDWYRGAEGHPREARAVTGQRRGHQDVDVAPRRRGRPRAPTRRACERGARSPTSAGCRCPIRRLLTLYPIDHVSPTRRASREPLAACETSLGSASSSRSPHWMRTTTSSCRPISRGVAESADEYLEVDDLSVLEEEQG